MDVDLDGASALPVAAFALSVVSIWLGVLLPWWQKREAHPEARLERLAYQTKQGWHDDERLAVVNHGPAVMRQVTVRLFNEDGNEHRETGSWPPMPIPEIHVGQALHLPIGRLLNEPQQRSAVLSWRDRRVRPRQQKFWVTWQRVT